MKRIFVILALTIGLLAVTIPVSAGVSPGIVTVSNYQNGIEVEYDISVFNSTDETQAYLVAFKIPDNTRSKEYRKAPPEAVDWVKISNPNPIIEAGGSEAINITFKAPLTANTPNMWEFQISVIQQGQGNVQVEHLIRWLIEEPIKWNILGFYMLLGFVVALATFLILTLYKKELTTVKNRIISLVRRK